MAKVRVQATGQEIHDEATMRALLLEHGIEYDRWDTSHLPSCVRDETRLTDEQKQSVLDCYRTELKRLIEQKGYRTADMVVLSPETPNLEALLDKFRKEHYHTEDEVRFVVDGAGTFFIRGKDEQVYEVEVHCGDLIIVPTHTMHWFDLTESRRIKCVRIFQTTEGWQAIYREPAAASA